MRVLSLFDGMAGARIAIERSGINVKSYYSSEIDKYSSSVARHNFSDSIELGDIRDWKNWNLPKIDLLIGGFPCQPYSVAGGKLGFKDDRGKLFFCLEAIYKAIKPKYFIFENVKMPYKFREAISSHLMCDPILINSSLVSAQNRTRYYWTNIVGVNQPDDKKIYLKDILESGTTDRDKSYCIDANYSKGGSIKNYYEKKRRQIVFSQSERRLCVLDSPTRIGLVDKGGQGNRIYDINGKSICLSATSGGLGSNTGLYKTKEECIRKLSPKECERLQTVPEGYTEHGKDSYGKINKISNHQRYKMLGNGFTIDVISHIVSKIK